MDKHEGILKRYAKIINNETIPPPRFGHTVNLISKTAIVVFGGAISSPGNYTMTADLYLYNIPLGQWRKLETSTVSSAPHARAAHASASVRENQLLFYGGSIGNGQYASDDLWFLDIKNNEDASWMRVPIEGPTPGQRYGHSMVYISPTLVLFGGSSGSSSSGGQRNEIMNDVWSFSTSVTPFRWEKVATKGPSPLARSYHNACVFTRKDAHTSDSMILFGGRDGNNSSLKDLSVLKKGKEEKDFEWSTINTKPNELAPIARHQHCSTVFGPFLIVVGGRTGNNQSATFDVFSFNSEKWFRFGTIGLFRHSIWTYFNAQSLDNVDLYLYIYGGFDSENNSQINSNLYRINLVELFSKNEILAKELTDYIKNALKKMSHSHHKNQDENKNHFELNNRVVVYNIPEENNLSTLIKEISYSKLTEVDKKIDGKNDPQINSKKTPDYDENTLKEFLALLPNPDEDFIPLTIKDTPIILNRDYIGKLIDDCIAILSKSPMVIKLKSPVKIYGSLFGAYNDLMRYFSLFGRPSEFKGDIECMDYLFLGNIVNRGAFSLETFCLLIALKIKYNNNFHILRGSHEDIEISKFYGLADECKLKLKENINDKNSIFKKICELFEYLPLAAIINNQILCVHSGIGDNVKSINDILNVKKPYSLSSNSVAQDILWSTPDKYEDNYQAKNATTQYRNKHFKESNVDEFLKNNNLKMIIRTHDLIEGGIDKTYPKVITIFSATNYCGNMKNTGAILVIKKNLELQPKILTCEEGYSVWINDNWSKTECPPSPKKEVK